MQLGHALPAIRTRHFRPCALAVLGAALLAGCAATTQAGPGGQPAPAATLAAASPAASPAAASPAAAAPRILDRGRAAILRANSGITLQWISWDWKGQATITEEANGAWRLVASQQDPDTGGIVQMDGHITEIGHDYFLFDGRITILNTPDAGRRCTDDKLWTFAITQNRPYWRLREFEWCDYLTDYIDIYF